MGVLRRAGPLLTLLLLLTAGSGGAQTGAETAPMTIPKPEGSVRIAQYNAALNRPGSGVLFDAILRRDAQVVATGDIIRRAAPDVLLLNEFDRDAGGVALAAYTAMLAEPSLDGVPGMVYAHRYFGPSNTGVPSGLDLDGDGEAVGPGDAWGWGAFPGQYAMAVLSRFPLGPVRSWQRFPWSWVPGGLRPALPDGRMYYEDAIWRQVRLSSKSHWAVPIRLPGREITLVAGHPTPPVFDGPENRNGRRNHDEIRLLHAIAVGADWPVDDAGQTGGIDGSFVIAGDLNADPADGEALREALTALLNDPRVQDPSPRSEGAIAAAEQGGANTRQAGDPAFDTADWRDEPGPGNLRVDYVLPSADLRLLGSGVFWPAPGAEGAHLVGRRGDKPVSSDHHLVWVDIALP